MTKGNKTRRWIFWLIRYRKGFIIPYRSASRVTLDIQLTDVQCMPILVSLETSENEQVADRALDLHQTLHSKHSTLVNVRFLECAQASFEYQRSITAEVSGQLPQTHPEMELKCTAGHRDGAALLSPWYSIISEKRSFKLDFIRQVCRAFDYSLSGSSKVGQCCFKKSFVLDGASDSC